MRGYDNWLEAPYRRAWDRGVPPEAEDVLGLEFTLDGEPAVVEDYEEWEDADEDGRYGGVDLVVRVGGSTRNITPEELDDALRGCVK